MNALEQYRVDEGLNYSELAARLKTSPQNVQRWCNGIEPRPADREMIEKRTKGRVKKGAVLIYQGKPD
ncbi:helix-turn-helix transcriptional regulator [Roseicella sp. DB1501]|uniref:helix-turn-helix domain-containing protein n=1 Tax=Roseicella sp. DB1501 TaxID=2730925 RepID=UPI0014912720|nr:helix-turn-helix transcriptional regulator [Roseicella sp. DB1501]NOG73730.1 helix-turn-helix domain-containing protein [Roseicella sp. DB1501]